MGLTSEFVWYRRIKHNFREETLCITVKERKVGITYGNHNSKDTVVIINVTVSFLCLLAAPWDGGRVPHQNFKAIEVYETQITTSQKQQHESHKEKGKSNCHCCCKFP